MNEMTITTKSYKKGHIYAVLYSNGWVKVGRSGDVQNRIKTLSGSVIGEKAVSTKASALLSDAHRAEGKLIAFCRKRCDDQHGKEWFSGIGFKELAQAVSRLEQEDRESQAEPSAPRGTGDLGKFGGMILESNRWRDSLQKAELLESVYFVNLHCGGVFEKGERGYSEFFLLASILLHNLSVFEQASLFSLAATDPVAGVNKVLKDGNRIAAREAYKHGFVSREHAETFGVVA